jgi:hypothetical protein
MVWCLVKHRDNSTFPLPYRYMKLFRYIGPITVITYQANFLLFPSPPQVAHCDIPSQICTFNFLCLCQLWHDRGALRCSCFLVLLFSLYVRQQSSDQKSISLGYVLWYSVSYSKINHHNMFFPIYLLFPSSHKLYIHEMPSQMIAFNFLYILSAHMSEAPEVVQAFSYHSHTLDNGHPIKNLTF